MITVFALQTWRDLAAELARAVRIVLTQTTPALLALVGASALYAAGVVRGNDALGTAAQYAGLVALLTAVAALIRAYAPAVNLPVIAPRRSWFYLLWAAVCVCWPIIVYLFVVQALLSAYGPVSRDAARTILLVMLLPLGPLFIVVGWAFADVAVSATTATSAVARVLRVARSPAVLLRAVVVSGLFLGAGWLLWYGLLWLVPPFRTKGLAQAAAYTVADVVLYALLSAVLLTTLPPVVEAAPKKGAGRQRR